jgi:thiamine-phosphate pyrophosphorylase
VSAISIGARYSVAMPRRQPLPLLWLLSDARNDAALDRALAALPEGSGFVFRHYHLDSAARASRFRELALLARERRHLIVFARDATLAAFLDADGVYGPADRLEGADDLLRLATAHDGAEIQAAAEAGADAVFLSPVFATRSHPDATALGVHGFHVLAQQSPLPVIALGGMTAARARELDWPRWGAIDGLAYPLGRAHRA